MRSFAPVKSLAALTLLATFALGPVAAVAQDATPAAEPGPPPLPAGAEVVAEGLDNPRGLTIGPDGALWIAEAGGVGGPDAGPCMTGPEGNEVCYNTTGAVTRVLDGEQERVVEGLRSIGDKVTGMNATGPHDLAFTADGSLYLIIGLGADPSVREENEAGGPSQLGKLFRVDPETGDLTEIADVAGYETENNPDGGLIDSNPFMLAVGPDDSLAVTDAGANALYRVDLDGTITPLAIFPDRAELMPDSSVEVPMNAVPTGLWLGPEDSFYVGQLTGFPFPVGGANVYRVNPAGSDPVLHSDGYTNIIDVAFAPNGDLYVLEFTSGGMLNIDPTDPATLTGNLIRITPDNQRDVVVAGLVTPTGLTIADDGTIYVANMGTMAGAGQVLRFEAPEPAAGTEAADEATADEATAEDDAGDEAEATPVA